MNNKRICIRINNEFLDTIKEYCKNKNITVSGFIKIATKEKLDRENKK